jgi:fibronectin-binding autotransporter adhesin
MMFMKTNLIRIQRPLSRALMILPALVAALAMTRSARAASATWLASPFNNNWIAAPTTNNWSTAGTFPGATSGTSSADIATFSATSTISTINCASAFVIGGIIFDTANASAYTINTSGGTWRVSLAGSANGAVIKTTSTVVNRQTITGTLRIASTGTITVTSDSTTPLATLNITSGISVNNSGTSGTLNLNGANTGNNIMGAFTEQTPATIFGTLNKSGTGTWVLTGNNTYHSNTIINAGTLVLLGAGAIPNSPNIIVNSGTLSVSNTMSTANNMFVTNSGTLLLTNTFFRTPLTIGTLTASNATFRLSVNGSTPFTNIVVTAALTTGPNIALAIDQVAALPVATTFALISYVGTDPDPGSFTVTVPASYSAGAVTVDTVNKLVTVTVTPPAAASSLVWVGATNSVLVSNWDTTTKNWLDAATLTIPQAYANPDSVQFDDNASNGTVTLMTTVTPFGVIVINNTLNYLFNGSGKISGAFGLNKQGSASLTLAETGGDDFSGGLTVNGGTVILDNTNSAISGGLTVASGATVQIGNNDGNGNLPSGSVAVDGTLIFSRSNNVIVSTSISGNGSLTQNGNGVLTLNNTNSYTGNTIVSKGSLALTGAGSISNSAVLVVSNATFDVSGIVGTTLLNDFNITNAIINVGPTNLQTPISVTSFEVDGITSRSNIINVLALPPIASYPATLTVIKSANPISLAGGNFNFALGSLPTASPSYAGSLSESGDSTAVLLTLTSGPIGVRSSVTWAGINNVSVTTNWSDRLNWQLPGAPVAADNVFFDGSITVGDNATINNVVDTSFTNATLTYNQTTSGQWHNTLIPENSVLTVTGATGIGTGTAAGSTTSVTISGFGELDADGAFNLNSAGGANDSHETLDMSGLSTFKNLAPAATMALGTAAQQVVTLSLASNSVINVATLNIEATAGNNGRAGTLNLGAITNTIYASAINISTGKGGTTKIQFGVNAPDGTVAIGGTSGGSARATMLLGNATSGSAVCNGQLLLAGHLASVMAGPMTLGGVGGSTGNGNAGTVTFDNGTFDVTSIVMGSSTSAHSSSGTFTVGGDVSHTATLTVSSAGGGSVILGNASITGGIGAGTLNINANGIANINCSITKNTTAGAINTATISLTDGTLNLMSGAIGTLAAPIDTLNLSDNGSSDTKIQLNVSVGVTNIVATAVNVLSGTTTLNINSISGVTGTTQIPLISYTGSTPFSGLVLGTVPAGYTGAALVDSGTTIDLQITPPAPLIWKGAVGSVLNSTWNTSTLNWLNGATPSIYADGDYVQFDDSASNSVATLAVNVSPAGLNVSNNVLNYTFNGTGKITGPVALVKQGSGALVLDNSGSNDFSGGANIVGGTLQIGNNDANGNLPVTGGIIDNGTLVLNRTDSSTLPSVISGTGGVTQNGTGTNKLSGVNTYGGATLISSGTIIVANAGNGNSSLGAIPGGAVTITNGGTLDVGGSATAQSLNFTNAAGAPKQFYIAGAGVGGNGVIVNNGTVNQQNAFQLITLTADATVGGPTRWDMRGNALITPMLDMGGHTLTKTGSNQMSMVNLIVTNGGSIIINSGIFSFETTSSNATTSITVNSGGVMGHFRENAGFFTAPITLNGGMIRDLNGTPGSTNDSPITLTANSYLDLNVNSTDLLRLNGVISESAGSFGLTKTNVGSFSLAATNTYSGTTLVAQGRLILANNGSIGQSKLITVASDATFDASQRDDGTLTLNANQTLTGFGTVTGIVVTASGSTIAPGSATSTGTLTFGNNVTLGGTNVMKLNKTSQTNDVLSVGGTLTLGGTLNVTNLAGTLAATDTFKLFSAVGGISGAFSSLVPAAPAAGLAWNTNTLTTDGVLRFIATVNTNPTNITATVSGSTLTLTWPADHTGWRLQAQTNSISTGLNSNWVDVAGSTTVNTMSFTINPANGAVFFRMVYP